MTAHSTSLPAALTARQMEVAVMLRQGLRQGEIAARLGISQRQVGRLAGQARDRAAAATSSHLVALLAQGRLQPGRRGGF